MLCAGTFPGVEDWDLVQKHCDKFCTAAEKVRCCELTHKKYERG